MTSGQTAVLYCGLSRFFLNQTLHTSNQKKNKGTYLIIIDSKYPISRVIMRFYFFDLTHFRS